MSEKFIEVTDDYMANAMGMAQDSDFLDVPSKNLVFRPVRKVDPNLHKCIKIHNSMIRTSSSFGLSQCKIIRMLLSDITQTGDFVDTYVCHISDLVKVLGLTRKLLDQDYAQDIFNALSSVQTIHKVIYQGEIRDIAINWVKIAMYSPSERTVTLKMNELLKPFLTNLKEFYTTYWLEQILKLPSESSIKMYEYIYSYKNVICKENAQQGIPHTFTFDEIRAFLQDKSKKRATSKQAMSDNKYYHSKLVPMLEAIHQHTDLKLKWEPVKLSRDEYALRIWILNAKELMRPKDYIAASNDQAIALERYVNAGNSYFYSRLGRNTTKTIRQLFKQAHENKVEFGRIREAIDVVADDLSAGKEVDSIIKCARGSIQEYIADSTKPLREANQRRFAEAEEIEEENPLIEKKLSNFMEDELQSGQTIKNDLELKMERSKAFIKFIVGYSKENGFVSYWDQAFKDLVKKCSMDERIDIRFFLNAIDAYTVNKESVSNPCAYVRGVLNNTLIDAIYGDNYPSAEELEYIYPGTKELTLERCMQKIAWEQFGD